MTAKYTSLFTVWRAGTTDVRTGNASYGNPIVYKGLFQQGGNLKLTDKMGQEFLPTSKFWSALEVVSGNGPAPSNDDLISLGDHRNVADPSTISTQQIRGNTIYDNSMFGESTDYLYGTK